MRLEGKVALITGAAAGVEGELMGFGGAAARLFAREGAKVRPHRHPGGAGREVRRRDPRTGRRTPSSSSWTSPATRTGRTPSRPRWTPTDAWT